LTTTRRAIYFSIAPLVCLLLFYRVFNIWFLNDDFAWLGLPLSVHNGRSLAKILFLPQAEGTVRVLSERLYFLLFSTLFGLNSVFFRAWSLLTWFADLALAAAIGARLTKSRLAGLLAALLWTSSVVVMRALAWASAYNQLLVALCLLTAFYARLRYLENPARKWQILEWTAYLAGFGALETIVMYPLLAALHGWTIGRPRLRNIAALAIPAAAFTAFHLFVLPPDPIYPIIVDHRMATNFLHYLGWSLGPRLLGNFPSHANGHRAGTLILLAIASTLALFLITALRRRDYTPLFFCAWFALLLAPVLPLPNNVQDYYLTVPVLGLAWLAGAALASAWQSGWTARLLALIALALYLPGTIHQIDDSTTWFLDRTTRLRTVVKGLRDASREHPGSAFILTNVDQNLYDAGFEDDPFRLLHLSQIYVADPLGTFPIAPRFQAPAADTLGWIDFGKARVLRVSPQSLTDITTAYAATLRNTGASAQHAFLDTGDPAYASLLGPEWYGPEQGFRWMPKRATVNLSGPGTTLTITGYLPASLLKTGPLELTVVSIGKATLQNPDEMFSLDFPLPPGRAGAITLEVNKTTQAPGDPRTLGLIVKTIQIH
jgi:hypothetical protein